MFIWNQQASWWPLGFRDWFLNAMGIFWGNKDVLELDSSGASAMNWLNGAELLAWVVSLLCDSYLSQKRY